MMSTKLLAKAHEMVKAMNKEIIVMKTNLLLILRVAIKSYHLPKNIIHCIIIPYIQKLFYTLSINWVINPLLSMILNSKKGAICAFFSYKLAAHEPLIVTSPPPVLFVLLKPNL